MKKIIGLVVCACLTICLVSCGENESKTVTGSLEEAFDTSATIEETVLVDSNGIKITAKDLTYSDYSADVNIEIVNNSGKSISVHANTLGYSWNSVNGIMIEDGYIGCDIPNGETAVDKVSFDYSQLEANGIKTLADIEIGFDISDSEYNDIYKGIAKIETSEKNSYDYEKNYYQDTISSDNFSNKYDYKIEKFETDTIFDVSNIKVISETVIVNQDEDPILFLELVNGTDKDYNISASNIYINDRLVEEYVWDSNNVRAGKKSIFDFDLALLLESTDIDVSNINKISDVKFTIEINDAKTYSEVYSGELEIAIPNVPVTIEEN